jgi:peptidoglycan/xylan/chitin deacetylase (PgdA/CDA1 family)
MVSRRLHIRFDIDTIVCLESGVPKLLDFARERDVFFSFFANLGRAYSPVEMVRGFLKPRSAVPMKAARLKAVEKLGHSGVLETLLLNPKLGKKAGRVLHHIVDQGHDLGLHGGRNHGSWQHGAQLWDEKYLEGEVAWGIKEFERLGLPRPTLFSSPGFNGPSGLAKILLEKGFKGLTDEHAWLVSAEPKILNGLLSFGTGLLAEPGGVGFFENRCAQGEAPEETRQYLGSILDKAPKRLMVYDHPAFTGVHGLAYLDACLTAARDADYRIDPLSRVLC